MEGVSLKKGPTVGFSWFSDLVILGPSKGIEQHCWFAHSLDALQIENSGLSYKELETT